MSDDESTPAAPAETTPAPAPVPVAMDLFTAVKEVLKKALINNKLARGIHESAKALDKRTAMLCVLSTKCDEPAYVRLIEALCTEHSINLLKVDVEAKTLGEWAGLCKIDKEGKARKVVSCSVVVVKEYGEDSEGVDFILNHFKGGH